MLDPNFLGQNITEEYAVDACELINNLAKTAGVSEEDVLADLACYRSKSGLWSKQFIWKSCVQATSLIWWKGSCLSRPLAKVAIKILELPATSAACERTFST